MQTVDTLIQARWIIPVEPENSVLEDHGIAIHNGKIVALLPWTELQSSYSSNNIVQLGNQLLIPGLVNAHTHCSMSLMRGLADDLPLMEWLQQHIWPAEQKWVDEAFVKNGTQLAIAEMIRSGTTCFNDMYFYPDITAETCAEIGMRSTVGLIVIDFPSRWAADVDSYFSRGLEVADQYRHHPLIKTAFAPHAPYSVSDQPLERVATLAAELELPIHMHVHETNDELHMSHEQHGIAPLQRLEKIGLLNPSLIAVHMTQLNDNDIELVAANSVQVVHCPESNQKLASGFCPVHRLQQAGVNVALGTDGAASNNDLNMLGEMRSAALLAKAVAGDPSALPAHQALEMATINGAKALGLDDQIGSLKPGKLADIVAINLNDIEAMPIYHPTSQLVYATDRQQVSNVWIHGKHLLADRQLTSINEHELRVNTQKWAERLA